MVLKVGGIVAVLAAVAALLGWLLLGLFHSPVPHDVPIAVVGSGPAAKALSKALDADPTFAVTPVATGHDARKLIQRRKIYGAYAPQAKVGRVIIASAASVPVAGLLQVAFTAADAKRGVKKTVVADAKPLPKGDSTGAAGYFMSLVAVVIAVLGGWWLEVVGPSIRRGWLSTLGRIGVLALISLITGAVLAALASALHVFDHHLVEVGGAFALTTFGMATVTAFLTSLTGGIAGLVIGLSVFILLGVLATSGGGSAPEFLPHTWKAIGAGLPPRSSIELVRDLVYFGGHAITTPLIVLGSYAVGGLVLMMGLSPFRRISS